MMHTEGARDRLHTNPKKKSLYHTLFNTSLKKNKNTKKKKIEDVSDTWVASLTQRKRC